MKHVSKALLLVLVLALTVGVFAACNRTKGLTKEGEALGNPETVARNKEPYSTTLIPYASVEQALGGNYSDSPYYKSLNGDWDFSLVLNPKLVPKGFETEDYSYSVSEIASVRKNENESASWGKISVPSNWEMEGYDAPSYTYNTYTWGNELVAPAVSESYNPVGLYRNKIEVPSDWKDRQVYVTFEGVSSCVYVYVNGALIGYAEDSYTGKTFNITEAVEFGKENLVVFEVYKYCDGSYLEANDSIKFGGVYRDVYLYAAPDTQIRDFTYDMQMDGEDALMNVTVELASYEEPSDELQVEISVYDADGNLVHDPEVIGNAAKFSEKPVTTANAYLGEVGDRIKVASPKLWSAETPNLYTVVLELKDGDKVVDIVSKRIGFKTVGITVDDNGNQSFVLNDKAIVLRGILYNENSAVSGMAVTREEMIADIKLMKELNINAVRSPGRPLSSEFIALCDEYGLYVIDDMSLNSNPYSDKDAASIPGDQTVWQNACLDRLLNVVYRDKNSASVIMWAIGNDSGTGSNFSVLRSWLISADNRMIVYDDDSSSSDLVIGSDLSLNDFAQLLSDTDNKKAVILQDTRGGLLNNGGNFSAYSDLMEEYSNFQGGFFAYWSDNAVYWPMADAAQTLQKTPYSEETASAYRLTYAGGWGENTSASDGYMSLSGVLTADRQLQSDAIELKNALSPIYISLEDAATGTYRVSNRNSFTDFADTYEISYEITDGTKTLTTGTVSGLELAAGESSTFTVNNVEGGLYIYFTIKYKSAPAWAENNDLTVFAKQISLTEDSSVVKDGTAQDQGAVPLNVNVFQAPEVYVSEYSFSKGQLYITNRSNANFSDLYSISWKVYERIDLWEELRWREYDSGTLESLNVPAGAVNYLLNLPVKTDGAFVSATYSAQIVITSKTDRAGVPAGTQFVYTLNAEGEAEKDIPFEDSPSRTATPIYADPDSNESEKEILGYEFSNPNDNEPEVNKETDLFEVPAAGSSYTGSSVIELTNENMTLKLNASTGLVTQYTVGGKDIFVATDSSDSSMQANLVRNPTGGDLVSSAVTNATLSKLRNLSQNNAMTKTLPNGYKIEKKSDVHYRVTLDYVWVTYPIQTMRAFSYDTYYSVVYDVFSTGEIEVSVKYEPTIKNAVPLELSSIMTLTSEFKTMSWYGMGSGESYSDKSGDGRVGVYEDVAIVDQLGDEYIYSTGSGDKTDLRWVALERADGSGIVITSDTDIFAVNVSKDYPWNTSAYASSAAAAASKNTVLRVIGQQRGVSANTLFDEEYSNASYIVPGVNYTYSFRIVPVNSGYDADKISRSTMDNKETEIFAENTAITLDNNSFALANAASGSTYLSSGADGQVALSAALGNASQYWMKEAATDLVDVAGAFRLKSVSRGLYLSPVSKATGSIGNIQTELTLAPYKNLSWQNWTYESGQFFANGYHSGGYVALYIAGSSDFSNAGARLALKAARSDSQSMWTIVADSTDPNKILIQSSASGKYLTVVDNMTYSDPLVQDYAFRIRNYPLSVDWYDYRSIQDSAIQYNASSANWTGSDYYVTQWDLLPSDSQMWTFVPTGGGYMIVNKQTGSALTVSDGSLIESAAAGSAEQIWTVQAKDGMYGILNGNMALTLRSVDGANKLTVQAWEELAIQLWSLSSENDLKVNVEAGSNWY